MKAPLQVCFRVDAWFREYAFLRTHDHYRWQRLPVAVAARLLSLGEAELVESESRRIEPMNRGG